MKTNVTYIISNINKALAFEWIASALDNEKFNLSFILLNPGKSALEDYLLAKNIPTYHLIYTGKKDIPKTFLKIRKLLKKMKTEIVHTHLFDASIVGLLAAKSVKVKKRIFTRHHGTVHHVYYPRAVYYDKFLNRLATRIIAISQNIEDILIKRENAQKDKVSIIHHGFKLDAFENTETGKIEALKAMYNTQRKSPVIGIIARQTHWKGVQYVLPAFKKILQEYPEAHLVLANAKGDYKKEIDALLKEIPVESYTEIVFEEDLFSLYQLFDIYVHTPIDSHSEAFGQTYIEALAAGIPSVFTLSGVGNEFIEHEKNAWVVGYKDSEAIYSGITRLLQDKELCCKLAAQGKKDVQELFALPTMINALEKLYSEK